MRAVLEIDLLAVEAEWSGWGRGVVMAYGSGLSSGKRSVGDSWEGWFWPDGNGVGRGSLLYKWSYSVRGNDLGVGYCYSCNVHIIANGS